MLISCSVSTAAEGMTGICHCQAMPLVIETAKQTNNSNNNSMILKLSNICDRRKRKILHVIEEIREWNGLL
jgi:hypothetical protein